MLQKVTLTKPQSADKAASAPTPAAIIRERIVRRAALEFKDGMFGSSYKSQVLYDSLLTHGNSLHFYENTNW